MQRLNRISVGNVFGNLASRKVMMMMMMMMMPKFSLVLCCSVYLYTFGKAVSDMKGKRWPEIQKDGISRSEVRSY